MAKKIVVLNGSPRANGNTKELVKAFVKGAESAGNTVQVFDLQKMNIHGCLGCCMGGKDEASPCVQKDDMGDICEKWLAADVVVLASPVYFYTWSSQMKAVLDRTFAIEQQVKDTDFYLISAAAAPTEDYMSLMLESFRKYVGCFRSGGNKAGGYVFGLGTNAPGDVAGSDAMTKAYELGRAL